MAPMMIARYFSKKVGGALTRPLLAALRRAADRDVAVEEVDVTGVAVAGRGALPVAGGVDPAAGGVAPAGAVGAGPTGLVVGV